MLNSRIAQVWACTDRNSIWQSASIVTGLLSAILVARGSFFASPELIVKLSSPMWDSNPDMVRAWASQIAEAKAGLVLMVLSVVLSLPALARDTGKIARNRVVGWIIGTTAAALLGLAAFAWADASANSLTNRTFEQLSQSDSASRQTPDPNSAITQATAPAPTYVDVDGTFWMLPDMDLNTLQAAAAIGTLLVTIILAVATWRYTAATRQIVAMQV